MVVKLLDFKDINFVAELIEDLGDAYIEHLENVIGSRKAQEIFIKKSLRRSLGRSINKEDIELVLTDKSDDEIDRMVKQEAQLNFSKMIKMGNHFEDEHFFILAPSQGYIKEPAKALYESASVFLEEDNDLDNKVYTVSSNSSGFEIEFLEINKGN